MQGLRSGHRSAGFNKGFEPFTWAVVLLVFSCTSGVVEGRLQNGTLTPGAVYTVCTAPFDPYVDCTVGLTPSDATGELLFVQKKCISQL